MIVGLILLLFGVMWLLETLGVVTPDWTAVIWPIVLIAVGAWLVYNHARWGRRGWWKAWR